MDIDKLWTIVDVPTPYIYKQQMVKALEALIQQEIRKQRLERGLVEVNRILHRASPKNHLYPHLKERKAVLQARIKQLEGGMKP